MYVTRLESAGSLLSFCRSKPQLGSCQIRKKWRQWVILKPQVMQKSQTGLTSYYRLPRWATHLPGLMFPCGRVNGRQSWIFSKTSCLLHQFWDSQNFHFLYPYGSWNIMKTSWITTSWKATTMAEMLWWPTWVMPYISHKHRIRLQIKRAWPIWALEYWILTLAIYWGSICDNIFRPQQSEGVFMYKCPLIG